MFFIFGFGKQTVKELGTSEKIRCQNCGNVRPWEYKKIRSWFSLFFIPVIPYKTVYIKSCPVCKTGLKVDKEEAVNHMQGPDIHDGLTDVQRNYREQMDTYNRKD
ncbi:zinc-ribbon domain-containing protein [Acidaminobacter sp. JC074]|uniref:zinc-ribbon domain-containing protein n=1 Tax=Acidaminobacter sp. JC074 TaxID=2530199 RepID=UPI001F10C806|nr:zinc-ribbon domain-containing protein [Acidaminobacter sp. JC074]MCH4888494.1 zinc-ribbon domain-containing protein [Acidaminobacter sp. JC074]